ncbi:MAG: hypothetical protein EBQ95_07210 [Gammaproteobacteria bacterium]|nr:hypothetical protein [Gammaproteobacteria bacterium]
MFYRLNILDFNTLSEAFAAIPKGVTSLDLSENNFGLKNSAEIAKVFAAIPKGVTSLNLNWNNFGLKNSAEIAEAFAAIPEGVTSLDLSGNISGNIINIFKVLPKQVTSIGLNFNPFFDVYQLDSLIAILSTSVTTVIINGNDFKVSDILLQALSPIDAKNRKNWTADVIEPQCSIDEKAFVQIIKYLQKHPCSKHFLISGLLLEGIIENSSDAFRANNASYFEKRVLLAIDFYLKAACDPYFSREIEGILWNMRNLYRELPAVIKKLEPFRLNPIETTNDDFLRDAREYCLALPDQIDLSEIANLELNISTKLAIAGFFGGAVTMGITLAISPTFFAMVTGAIACMPQIIAIVAAVSICAIAIGLLAYGIGLICEESTYHEANEYFDENSGLTNAV